MSSQRSEGITLLGHFSPDQRWIKSSDLRIWQSAEELLDKAHKQAEEMLKKAEREAQRQKKRGFDQGYLEAQAILADKLIAFEAACAQKKEQDKLNLAELVFEALTKILGELSDELWYEKCLRKVECVMTQSKSFTLVIHPHNEPVVQQVLKKLTPHCVWLDTLRLELDESLPSRSCLVHTEHGAIDAGLQFQLKSILRALEVYFGADPCEFNHLLTSPGKEA
jgi:type III secretion system HrpE/YscL family protein